MGPRDSNLSRGSTPRDRKFVDSLTASSNSRGFSSSQNATWFRATGGRSKNRHCTLAARKPPPGCQLPEAEGYLIRVRGDSFSKEGKDEEAKTPANPEKSVLPWGEKATAETAFRWPPRLPQLRRLLISRAVRCKGIFYFHLMKAYGKQADERRLLRNDASCSRESRFH